MTRDEDPVEIPDLVLERYRLGELPPAEAEAVARRRDGEEEVRLRLDALARSDEEIRDRYPAGWLSCRVRARRAGKAEGPQPSAWSRYWPLPVSLAAGAILVAVLGPEAPRPAPVASSGIPSPLAPATERIKGLKPGLSLFRKTGDRSEALADGDVARPGDLIRVGYRAAGRRFGMILSLDGRGHVTVHLPTSGRQAAPLEAGDVVLLDHAFELDDAPRWERFFFVTSEAAFEIAPLVEDARRASAGAAPPAALKLPPPFEQSAFSLDKEARP